MQPVEITYFAVTLFAALAALINWKRRRDLNQARLNRGLRGYMAATDAVRLPVAGVAQGEDLIAV
jgi:hypothetical protein